MSLSRPTVASTTLLNTTAPTGLATTSSSSTSTSASSTSISAFTSLRSSSSTTRFTTLTSSSTPSPSPAMSTSTTTADLPSATGVVNPGNDKYSYYGCYNETTALNQTSGRRALYGGSMEGLDTMTVDICLNFCNIDGFAFAGLEYESECWCAQYLSVFAVKIPDNQCNFACKGNSSEICGGSLKLSIYQQIQTPSSRAPRSTNMPTKLFIVGLAIAGLILEML